MKLLTYKGHPVINLEQVCSMRIEHSGLVMGKFQDHYIVFLFHNNERRWKMESEEETNSVHAEIISGILGGNAHIILEETKEETEELTSLTLHCLCVLADKEKNGEQKGTLILEQIQKSCDMSYDEARQVYRRWTKNNFIGNI